MKTQAFGIWIRAMAIMALWAIPFTDFSLAVPPTTPVRNTEIDPVPPTAVAAAGLNYFDDFEAPAHALGYISNTTGLHPLGCGGVAFPCWGHTAAANASLITPTVENLHPASGLQHLRLSHDPSTRTNIPNWGLGVDARYPRGADLSPRPVAPITVSVDIAISNPGGMNYRIQPQSNSQGLPVTYMLFDEDGGIWALDDFCGTEPLDWIYTGTYWDTTGAYQNLTIAMNPCLTNQDGDTLDYYYGGEFIYTGCIFAGTNLEQFLVFGDNYPGSHIDVDNLIMSSLDECPHACGNGVIEYGYQFEQCEVTPGGDFACPGRCIAAGQPGECTCTPICTQANPCPVVNGANGPFMTSGGYYVFIGDAPYVSVDGCGTDFDASLTLGTAAGNIISNSDCVRWESNSDASASCYVPYCCHEEEDPCTCMANPGEPILIRMTGGPLGGSSILNIREKAACAGASAGSCCDTNGPDQGCTDGVAEADCTGPDKIWTDQGQCADQQCACIPDCTGAVCGSDGCGGSCGGSCDDGIVCNGSETCNASRQCVAGPPPTCDDGNACNGIETCVPPDGCVGGTPLICSDGLACNGMETCNPQLGCVAGTATNCDDGLDCTVDACNEPDGTCSHDNSDCAIPTVSQWGLVVLTIVLLVAAKVRFGRAWRVP